VWRDFPELGLASKQEPLLLAAYYCRVSEPSPRIQQHENTAVNVRYYKSRQILVRDSADKITKEAVMNRQKYHTLN